MSGLAATVWIEEGHGVVHRGSRFPKACGNQVDFTRIAGRIATSKDTGKTRGHIARDGNAGSVLFQRPMGLTIGDKAVVDQQLVYRQRN